VTYALKRLPPGRLEGALAMARHYRDLNQPDEAESICRDVLDVAPENEEALRTLGLALTDRFPSHWMRLFDEAVAVFSKLSSGYERAYYTGIAWERYAKAEATAGGAENAVHAYEQAITHYETAERLDAGQRFEPILRYNCCVRALTSNRDLVRASITQHLPRYDFGD
jgi:tetratricopeptide (TPR) repeat protein